MFLLDSKDSVQAYEEAGKLNKQESQYEKGMKALASMGHVQKLTAIEGKTYKVTIILSYIFLEMLIFQKSYVTFY